MASVFPSNMHKFALCVYVVGSWFQGGRRSKADYMWGDWWRGVFWGCCFEKERCSHGDVYGCGGTERGSDFENGLVLCIRVKCNEIEKYITVNSISVIMALSTSIFVMV